VFVLLQHIGGIGFRRTHQDHQSATRADRDLMNSHQFSHPNSLAYLMRSQSDESIIQQAILYAAQRSSFDPSISQNLTSARIRRMTAAS